MVLGQLGFQVQRETDRALGERRVAAGTLALFVETENSLVEVERRWQGVDEELESKVRP
jgi:hypothetical protein